MRKSGTSLTREQVLAAGLKMLDEEGIAGLSMRKLASALNVEAMSLYNHVKDKQDLLDGLCNLVFAQIELPGEALPWIQRLEAFAINLYQGLLLHPAIVLILASEEGRPTDMRVMQGMENLIGILSESGLSPQHQVSAYRGLLAMCFGFVLAHTQGLRTSKQAAQSAWDQWDSQQWSPDTLPHLARLAPQFMLTHADDDFKFMLDAYLNALKQAAASEAG